jgi:hypothetical protein
VILSAAGHTAENVEEFVERTGDVAVFGRYFSTSRFSRNDWLVGLLMMTMMIRTVANPDLPARVYGGHPIRNYDRSTFYSSGPVGYTDLPTYEQEVKQEA